MARKIEFEVKIDKTPITKEEQLKQFAQFLILLQEWSEKEKIENNDEISDLK